MLLNKNKILMLAVMGAIANIPSGADAQTFYQCKPKACNGGEYFNGTGCVKLPVTCSKDEILSGGKCYSTNTSGNWTELYSYSSGEGSATLGAGTYIVSLHGGNGGINTAYDWKGISLPGGTVTYQFTVDKSWTFKYGVGQNAPSCKNYVSFGEYSNATGGGGGSWISINGQYIVAGGGGGFSSGGGAGGAIGAGASSTFSDMYNNYYSFDRCNGGSSGNYSTGSESCVDTGYRYGPDDDYFESMCCAPGNGINSYNGGSCDSMVASLTDVNIYPGFSNIQIGGAPGQPGSATHATNTTAVSGCGTSAGCVKLYKFKY